MTAPILLLTPLPQESAGIRRRLGLAPDGAGLWRDGARICLAHTGMGPERASLRTAELLERLRPQQLLLFGVAGAARSGLAAGDLVLIERAHAPGEDLHLDRDLLAQLHAAAGRLNLPEHRGAVLEVPALVARAEDKARRGQAAGVDLLDMETASVARAAARAGVPCAAARVVWDTVSEDLLPLDLFCDAEGRTCWGPLLRYLAVRPWHIPRLLDYGARTHAAAALFGRLVESLLRNQPVSGG